MLVLGLSVYIVLGLIFQTRMIALTADRIDNEEVLLPTTKVTLFVFFFIAHLLLTPFWPIVFLLHVLLLVHGEYIVSKMKFKIWNEFSEKHICVRVNNVNYALINGRKVLVGNSRAHVDDITPETKITVTVAD